jgi:hypothetical protein
MAPPYPAHEDPFLADSDEQADQDSGGDSSCRVRKRSATLDLVDQKPHDGTDLRADQNESRCRAHPLPDYGSQGY